MASVSWTATTNGTWSNGANWSLPAGPLTGDAVTIAGVAGLLGVTYAAETLAIQSLTTTNTALTIASGALHVTQGYNLSGTLAVAAGALMLDAGNIGSLISGAVTLSGGTLGLAGGATLAGSVFNQSGGTLSLSRGALLDQAQSTTLSGLVSGGGQLALDGASTIIGTHCVLSNGSVDVENTTVFLNEALSYGGAFTLSQGGTLNLGTSVLTLSGLADLEGTVANATLALTGTGHLNQLTLENGATAAISGTYSQTGNVNLGQLGTGAIGILASGTLREVGNGVITNAGQGGTLTNAGLLIKTGGNGVSGSTQIYASLVNTGTIDSTIGTIAFFGPSNGYTSTLGGTITGAGSVAFDAGNFLIASHGTAAALTLTSSRLVLSQSAAITLTSNALGYAGDFVQNGGTLIVGVPGTTGGSTLTLSGLAALDNGLLKGTGTVLCSGAVHLGQGMSLEGNLSFDFGTATSAAQTVSQTGTILLGQELDAITLARVGAAESWLLEGNASIAGTNGTITNTGLFTKASGSGTSIVQSDFLNTGSLVAASGVLNLSGGGTLGGIVTGAAALDISGGNLVFGAATTTSVSGTSTLTATGPTLALTTGELILDGGQITLDQDLAYAGGWSQESGTLALATFNTVSNGTTTTTDSTLTLGGITSLASGAIEGPGAVVVNGAAVLNQGPYPVSQLGLLQGAQLTLNGATEQAGTLQMTGGSASPTLTVGATGSYTLDLGADIGTPNGSVVGTVVVAGTLSASAAGTSTVTANVVDTGSIRVASGDLAFIGTLSGAGTLGISSGGTLELGTSNTITTGVSFGTGGGVLSLDTPATFASTIVGFAAGDEIELQGFAFAHLTPTFAGGATSGKAVTLTETNGQSITLNFSTTQSLSSLTIFEGPHGGLALVHT